MKQPSRPSNPNPPSLPTAPPACPDTVFQAALAYRQAGLSLIPIAPNGTKAPASWLLPRDPRTGRPSWKPFCQRIPTTHEIQQWFGGEAETLLGLAIIAGRVSGGLEILDFDEQRVGRTFLRRLNQRNHQLCRRLVRVQTPRPGLHLYFRSRCPGPSRKLATIPDPTCPDRQKTLLELKGEGGYCLAPPSPGLCHPSGRPYRLLPGPGLTDIPQLTAEERDQLLELAAAFHRGAPLRPARGFARPSIAPRPLDRRRPGDHFAAVTSWAEILAPHGWQCERTDDHGVSYWTRPGKHFGTSATTNHAGRDLFYVFSENAAPWEAGRSYDKLSAYALLEHHGNRAMAEAALHRAGYGSPTLPSGPGRDLTAYRRAGRALRELRADT